MKTRLLKKLKLMVGFCFLLPYSLIFLSCNEKPVATINRLDVKKEYYLGDFTLTIPEGAVARQKMIPAPNFLQARFSELGFIPPKKIQITFWFNEKTNAIEMLKYVRFLDYCSFDSIHYSDINSKTRISFINKYETDEGLENGIDGYCDYFGYEIKFKQWKGSYTDWHTFLKIGNQTLYFSSIGNRDSKYKLFLDDSMITSGYAENTLLFYDNDSLKRQLLEE